MRRALFAAGLLSAFLLPAAVFAGGTLEIADSIAGLSLNVDVYGFESAGSATVSVSGPDGTIQALPVTLGSQGAGQATVSGQNLTRAGLYSASVFQNGSPTGAQTTFTIYPDEPSFSLSKIAADRTTIVANGQDDVAVAVHLTDKFGNGIADRPLILVPSRSQDIVVSLDTQTDGDGWQRFVVRTTKAGAMTLRATDLVSGQTLDTVITVEALPGDGIGGDDVAPLTAQLVTGAGTVVEKFKVALPASMQVGIEAQAFTVSAVDATDNVVPSYNNRVRFRSSDPLAELPGLDDTYRFISKDQGSKTFALAVKFGTPGQQTVTVEDANDPSIKGSVSVNVTGSASSGGGTIQITSPAQNAAVGGKSVTLIGKGPPLANIASSGGLTIARGATMDDGSFALTVPLPTDQSEVTLSISDDSGRFKSPNLHLLVDSTAPKIESLVFTPERPVTGTTVKVVLQTSAADTDVVDAGALIRDNLGTLFAAAPLIPSASAVYQGSFVAGEAGKYQVTGQAVDLVGNTGSTVMDLFIRPLAPTAVNVTPKGRMMEVSWTAPTGKLDGYRVYIGEKQGDWTFALDTRQTATPLTTSAVIKDLDAGKSYFFAVSAALGDLESDLSPSAQQNSLGLGLGVTPADSALALRWSTLPASIPVSGYQLKFGLKPDALNDVRNLPITSQSGGEESYILTDLINGLTYYVSLTPLAGGNPLLELTATGQGIPSGSGHASPGTYVPHGGAPLPPAMTDNGPADWIWWIIGSIVAVLGVWQWSSRRRDRLPVPPPL